MYGDQGLVVFGLGSDDSLATLQSFEDQMGLTFPVLHDEDGLVHASYSQDLAFSATAYPQDWLIGTDGTVAYVNNGYDPEALSDLIEEQLGL